MPEQERFRARDQERARAEDRERAYAKVNLCLFLGPTRPGGRHELVTLFESVSLADELQIDVGGGDGDDVVCEGVEGPNLVDDALAALRRAGWAAPPVRVEIVKRIPLAAGLGGGSADAAAMLRAAPRLAPVPESTLRRIAVGLGADVPSQLHLGPSIGTGAGEVLEPVRVAPHAVLVLPAPFGLATADVYREADRLGLPRPDPDLVARRAELQTAMGEAAEPVPAALVTNDLQPAALSLRPEIGEALAGALGAGADQALVCGSGPTVIGIFWGLDGVARAAAAADQVRGRRPEPVVAEPVP